jgi:hypothetical protein
MQVMHVNVDAYAAKMTIYTRKHSRDIATQQTQYETCNARSHTEQLAACIRRISMRPSLRAQRKPEDAFA